MDYHFLKIWIQVSANQIAGFLVLLVLGTVFPLFVIICKNLRVNNLWEMREQDFVKRVPPSQRAPSGYEIVFPIHSFIVLFIVFTYFFHNRCVMFKLTKLTNVTF